MAVYLISDVIVRHAKAVQTYRTLAADSITKYGGKYLTRGGEIDALEGDWNPQMIVIVEFPDKERVQAWYESPEYALALEVRDTALSRNLILVEGVIELAALRNPGE